MYNIGIKPGKKEEEDNRINKLKLYFCSKCENASKKPYKTKTCRDSHEVSKHNFNR